MSKKRHKPKEIVAKLRQVEVLAAQGLLAFFAAIREPADNPLFILELKDYTKILASAAFLKRLGLAE